jgi:hypothetical protein
VLVLVLVPALGPSSCRVRLLRCGLLLLGRLCPHLELLPLVRRRARCCHSRRCVGRQRPGSGAGSSWLLLQPGAHAAAPPGQAPEQAVQEGLLLEALGARATPATPGPGRGRWGSARPPSPPAGPAAARSWPAAKAAAAVGAQLGGAAGCRGPGRGRRQRPGAGGAAARAAAGRRRPAAPLLPLGRPGVRRQHLPWLACPGQPRRPAADPHPPGPPAWRRACGWAGQAGRRAQRRRPAAAAAAAAAGEPAARAACLQPRHGGGPRGARHLRCRRCCRACASSCGRRRGAEGADEGHGPAKQAQVRGAAGSLGGCAPRPAGRRLLQHRAACRGGQQGLPLGLHWVGPAGQGGRGAAGEVEGAGDTCLSWQQEARGGCG